MCLPWWAHPLLWTMRIRYVRQLCPFVDATYEQYVICAPGYVGSTWRPTSGAYIPSTTLNTYLFINYFVTKGASHISRFRRASKVAGNGSGYKTIDAHHGCDCCKRCCSIRWLGRPEANSHDQSIPNIATYTYVSIDALRETIVWGRHSKLPKQTRHTSTVAPYIGILYDYYTITKYILI